MRGREKEESCIQDDCERGCVCRMGLVRSRRGDCVPIRDCRKHRKPQVAKNEPISSVQEGVLDSKFQPGYFLLTISM